MSPKVTLEKKETSSSEGNKGDQKGERLRLSLREGKKSERPVTLFKKEKKRPS